MKSNVRRYIADRNHLNEVDDFSRMFYRMEDFPDGIPISPLGVFSYSYYMVRVSSNDLGFVTQHEAIGGYFKVNTEFMDQHKFAISGFWLQDKNKSYHLLKPLVRYWK